MADTQPIVPVILSGGSGTRLWPVSRKSFPKQFAPLVGDETLFQASARPPQTPPRMRCWTATSAGLPPCGPARARARRSGSP